MTHYGDRLRAGEFAPPPDQEAQQRAAELVDQMEAQARESTTVQEDTGPDLTEMTNEQLRDQLRELGLSTQGNKDDLIARLNEAT